MAKLHYNQNIPKVTIIMTDDWDICTRCGLFRQLNLLFGEYAMCLDCCKPHLTKRR